MTVNLNSKENKVKSITLNLSAIEFMIFHEAISVYAEERENEIDKEIAKRMLNVIEEMKRKTTKEKGVLEQIAEEQKTLLDTTKAWNKALEKRGYVN